MAQILMVDDSSTVRNEVGDFLTKNGLSVSFAVDGRDGLVKLKADPSIKLVVCDVNMPNMAAMKECGKAAGIKGWIVKPFKGEAVLATFKKLVGT